MLDALFWYTGLAVWIVIVFGWVAMLYIHVREQRSMRRASRSPDR